MTRKEMTDAIMEALGGADSGKGMTRLQVESALEAFGNVAAAELLGGGEVSLGRMGKLKIRPYATRRVRNPRTGEEMLIPAHNRAVFAPGREFREALKG